MYTSRTLDTVLLLIVLWTFLRADLITNIEPAEFQIGLTRSLKVECLYRRDKNSTLTFLMSLSLYFSPSTKEPEYTDLVTINSFDSRVYGNVANSSDTEIFGSINNTAESMLRIVWKYPQENRVGVYRCEANGINPLGKPASTFSTSLASGSFPRNEQVVDAFKKLTDLVEQLQADLKSTNQNVVNIDKTLEKQSEDLNLFQNKVNTFNSKALSALKYAIFYPSHLIDGRRYWLTNREYFFKGTEAEAFCEFFGGYLAEIDSDKERDIIEAYVKNNGLFDIVYVGGTDEEQEGVWKYKHSNTTVKYLNWENGEPNGGRGENCLAYHISQLYDITCSFFPYNKVGFLCEIPE
ncbi:C-type lectin domain family 3 member A isoform X2 [Biomphalaria glabrata]|nr:C-type lectin domain family 3 member A isoform X2 [Biomphalaria glabrata]